VQWNKLYRKSHSQVVQIVRERGPDRTLELLAPRRNILWCLKDGPPGRLYIACVVLRLNRRLGWEYLLVQEDVPPKFHDCPIHFLDFAPTLSPVWRAHVFAFHAQRAQADIGIEQLLQASRTPKTMQEAAVTIVTADGSGLVDPLGWPLDTLRGTHPHLLRVDLGSCAARHEGRMPSSVHIAYAGYWYEARGIVVYQPPQPDLFARFGFSSPPIQF
jgi:hypothetical protein